MAYGVFVDKQVRLVRESEGQCVAEILVKGWYTAHRYGVVFTKGVEIKPIENSPPLASIDEVERA